MTSLASGVAWTSAARAVIVLVGLVVGIVVARIVGPTEMGHLSLALVMLTIAEGVFGVGLSRYLVRRSDASQADRSVGFWGDVSSLSLGAVVLLASTPFIASAYGNRVRDMVYVLVIGCVLTGLASPIRNVAYSQLNFRGIAKSELVASIGSALGAVAGLALGWGVWAIIFREILKRVLVLGVLLKQETWRPSFMFSKDSFRRAAQFSAPLYGVETLAQATSSLDQLLIGQRFSSADVGVYSRGQSLALLPLRQLIMVAAQILFPLLGQVPKKDVPNTYRQATSLMFLVGVPAAAIAALLGPDLIELLLGPEWREAGFFVSLFAPAALWGGTSDLLRSVFNSQGRSDLTLRSTTVSRVLRLVGVGVGAFFSVQGLAIGVVCGIVVGSAIEHHIARKFLDVPFGFLLKGVGPIGFAGVFSSALAMPALFMIANLYVRIAAVCFVVLAGFFGALHVSGNGHWQTALSIVRSRRAR